MKKFKNIKLMLVGLLALVGMNAFAANEYVYKDNCVYKIVDATANPKTVNFLGLSEKFDVNWDEYTLVIPAQIENVQAPGTGAATTYKVVGFESGWFGPQNAGEEFGTQEIEKNVQKIQFNIVAKEAAVRTQVFAPIAWNSWTALKEYTIGDNAVRLCEKVPQVDPSLKYRLTKIDLHGVSNDKDPVAIPEKFADGFNVLETIVLPTEAEAVTIGDLAFNQAKKVSSIDLSKVTTIGKKAFQDAGFTALTIPANVESIGEGAFWGLEKATAITINTEKMTTVPANIFSKLTAVKTVTIASSTIASIEKYAFSSATAIENINLENATALASIGEGAFATAAYKNVNLLNTLLENMGGISLASSLGTFNAAGVLTAQGSLETIVFPKNYKTSIPCLKGTKISSISIPATATGLADQCFKDCQALETVDLSACTFTTIPVSAFEMTVKLTGDKAFKNGVQQYNTKLAEVSLPGTITTINASAFKNCSLLNPDLSGLTKLASLGNYAFYGTSIEDAALGGAIEKTSDGKNYLFTSIGDYAFAQNYKLATATIPAGIQTIGANAFELVNEITTTTDENYGKFFGVLENLTFNNLGELTANGIGANAFNGGIFTTLDLESAPKLETIPTLAFANNPELKTVTLPAQINTIQPQAFLYATALEDINLNQTDIIVLNNLFTPDGSKIDESKSLENLAKNNDGELVLKKDPAKTVKVSDTETRALRELTTVAEYALQFTGIKKIVIPSTVSAFGVDTKTITLDDETGTTATSPKCDNGRVFEGCTKLEEFEWTNVDPTITSLPQYCFLGNTALKKVTFLTTSTAAVVKDAEVFYLCSGVEVYLTADSYNATVADGYGNDNRQYSVLKIKGNKVFKFSAKGQASDGYYYATYCNQENSSWFKANTDGGDGMDFDVYTAVIEGSKVVLKKASVDGGYYKVAKASGSQKDPTALCIVRSKNIEAIPELNSNGGNMKVSTLPTENELLYNNVIGGIAASKLKYQFKLGNKDGQVAFWRVTSGTIKEGVIYVEGTAPAGRMDFVVEGEGEVTGIENIFAAEEDDAPVYNLQGTQVKAAKKGMYIKNGKKFIVK